MLVDLCWLSPRVLGINWHAKQQDVNGIYYVRETKRGMMATDSELTKQLSSHTLLKNSIKFK